MKSVRTFVMAVDLGQFLRTANRLAISQQAVSKRIAALEQELGVTLLKRGAQRVVPTIDGQVFLPHARELIEREDRALASVAPRHRRTLRVDTINCRGSQAALMHDFRESHPSIDIDLVTIVDGQLAIKALLDGEIDATLRALGPKHLPEGIEATRAYNEPHWLLVGPHHLMAAAHRVSLDDLAGHKIWIPGTVIEAEWTDYYHALATEFGLNISAIEQGFTAKELTAVIAESPDVATLEGERSRFVWPKDYDLRRIEIIPVPLYPHNLLWRAHNPHPDIEKLRNYIEAGRQDTNMMNSWLPEWAI